MAVLSTSRTDQLEGNGTSNGFALNFLLYDVTDLQVFIQTTGVLPWVLLTLNTDYTVSGVGVFGSVVIVTFTVTPTALQTVLFARTVPFLQEMSLLPHDPFPASTVTEAFDLGVMMSQQLNDRLTVVEGIVGSAYPTSEPFVYANNALLALKNAITASCAIPVGFNALAINPTIPPGVTVSVPTGSIFTILGAGGGTGGPGGGASLSADNIFAGRQYFGTQAGNYIFRIDPNVGDGYISRSNNLPADPTSGELNGWAADVTQSSGSVSIVPIHGHAVSAAIHSGNAWGAAFESYNNSDKNGAGLVTQLFGMEASVINEVSTSIATRHAGALLTFKNRLDTQDTPVNGLPSAGNAYNNSTSALYIDTGAGRIGSSSSPNTGNNAIECGWNKGVYFSPQALDSANGVKAIAIDATALDNPAPEGGRLYARVQSFLAIPSETYNTFSTDRVTAQHGYKSATGTLEYRNNGNLRFGVNLTNGILYQWDGTGPAYAYWVDAGGPSGAVMNVRSATKTTPPADPTTVKNWLRFQIDGISYAFAGYQ